MHHSNYVKTSCRTIELCFPAFDINSLDQISSPKSVKSIRNIAHFHVALWAAHSDMSDIGNIFCPLENYCGKVMGVRTYSYIVHHQRRKLHWQKCSLSLSRVTQLWRHFSFSLCHGCIPAPVWYLGEGTHFTEDLRSNSMEVSFCPHPNLAITIIIWPKHCNCVVVWRKWMTR